MYSAFCCCSVAQSCPTLCDPMNCITPGFPVHLQLPELAQTHHHWISDAIQPSHPLFCPLLLLPSVFPSTNVFCNELSLCISWPKYWTFSFSTSPSNEYSGLNSFKLIWSHCSPRDSQEFSPAPQFKTISSLAVSLCYGPTLTSIHDYWKNQSFDYTDFWQQSDVFAF